VQLHVFEIEGVIAEEGLIDQTDQFMGFIVPGPEFDVAVGRREHSSDEGVFAELDPAGHVLGVAEEGSLY
jgi:hypothetical protein